LTAGPSGFSLKLLDTLSMNSTVVRCFLFVVLSFLGPSLPAQTFPDIIVFDQGDPIGVGGGYYDASVGLVTPPSAMTLAGPSNQKMIILTNIFYTGKQSGLIQWKSAPGGNWALFVASPGFQTLNASGYSNIIFYLNGPAAVAATNLPQVGLESSLNKKTSLVRMGNYLPAGLDGDTNTWQLVSIPLADFQPYNGFVLSQFKDVNFNQGLADGVTNTLWLDGVRIVVPGSSTNLPTPSAPLGLVTRSGDQSVVLHWYRSPEVGVAGYNVYRAQVASGPFALATATPVTSPSFADLSATNGQTNFYLVRALNLNNQESTNSAIVSVAAQPFASDDDFLEYLQHLTFDYFWYEAGPTNGLVRDRSEPFSPASMAATGFGLTGIGIGIDHGWITRAAGRDRTLVVLQTLWSNPQSTSSTGTIGYRGWFYHFVDVNAGVRFGSSELSSIDTALLLGGVLYARQYFNGTDTNEVALRNLATAIYDRVDWQWMANGQNALALGWFPETGFLGANWIGYNEAMLLYVLGLGAPTNPLPPVAWTNWTSGYSWQTNYGFSFVAFPPLFGHQYSHCWLDFRHIADPYMQAKGSTYFENSRRATLAQRQYCMANPQGFAGYSGSVWGLTACDGPGSTGFFGYIARGTPPPQNDDGTLAPTAPGGSLPFAPEICLPALRYLYTQFRTNIWTGYGFRDAFNLQTNWWDADVIGIDQGPILLMVENYRSQKVWQIFSQNPEVQTGLAAAGFVRLPFVSPSLAYNRLAGSFTVSWPGSNGRSYQVEYSPNLLNWVASPLGLIQGTGNGFLNWVDTGPPATVSVPAAVPERFYRVFQLGSP
jgi:hypothetical protein